MKYFLLIYVIAFYGAAFFWRTFWTWKSTGVNPYKLGYTDGIHGFAGKAFRIVSFSIVVVVSIFSFFEQGYEYLAPILWLENKWLAIVGVMLLLIAFLLVLIAQIHMGDSWRIGIDNENQTDLIRSEYFSIQEIQYFWGFG